MAMNTSLAIWRRSIALRSIDVRQLFEQRLWWMPREGEGQRYVFCDCCGLTRCEGCWENFGSRCRFPVVFRRYRRPHLLPRLRCLASGKGRGSGRRVRSARRTTPAALLSALHDLLFPWRRELPDRRRRRRPRRLRLPAAPGKMAVSEAHLRRHSQRRGALASSGPRP